MERSRPITCTRAQFLRSGFKGIAAAAILSAIPSRGKAQTQSQPPQGARSMPGNDVKPYDVRDFLNWVVKEFEPSARLPGGAGRYVRRQGDTDIELYGTCDMACILYTLGRLHPTEKERSEWADAFATFQDPLSGMLIEKSPTHSPLHNTAFALGAMQLLDQSPRLPLKMDLQYADPRAFLNTLDWKTAVYTESHKGAGIGAIYALAPGLGSTRWFAEYFATCDSLFDPNNGLMGKGKPAGGDFDQVGGTFHYAFLYHHFNRRLPYPEKRIDAIIGLQRPDGHWDATNRTWLTMDAIYLLTRTVRYCPHRVDEVNATIRRSLDALVREVYSPEARKQAFAGKMPVHTMTCAVSALAEAQQYFGADVVISDWPLRMILDRRPFI
jgi:hypothetical protein